jgi:hypothetical protein
MSVDNIKSAISNRGGLARTNRFLVTFNLPASAAASAQTFKGGDPRDLTFLCESTQIPGRNINTLEYQTNKETIKLPNGFIDDDVTMTFLLTNDYYMKNVFESWMGSIVDTEQYQVGYKKDFQTDVTIQKLDLNDKKVYGIRLMNAYPILINAIDLNNSTTDEVQRVTVTFAYDRYMPE